MKTETKLRKPLGQLELIQTASFNFTSDPTYYKRAADDPEDYLGTRIMSESEFREASYLTATDWHRFEILANLSAPPLAIVSSTCAYAMPHPTRCARGHC